MKEIIITEKQLEDLVNNLKENHQSGSYMAKQQLFTIAISAYKMWEEMEDDDQLEDWMESKIAQTEQSITSVVKAFMYDELKDGGDLDLGELVIGK
jgi:ribosomal protein L10